MALSAVTIPGASSGNTPLLSRRQTRLAGGSVSRQINQSAVNASLVPSSASLPAGTIAGGADTIFAGTSSLLISMGGVDSLSAAPQIIQFQKPHGRSAQGGHTPTIGSGVGFAATGNQTLVGGNSVAPTGSSSGPAPGPAGTVPGAALAMATVLGAPMAGSLLVLDPGQGAGNPPPNAAGSVTGGSPDLLLGWSFETAGYTLNFNILGNHPRTLGTPLGNGTDVRFSGAPKSGTIEIIFPRPS